jgi:hypothetical protein
MQTTWKGKYKKEDLYKGHGKPLPFNKEQWEEDAQQFYNWNAAYLKMPTEIRVGLEDNYRNYRTKQGEWMDKQDTVVKQNKAKQAIDDSIAMVRKARSLDNEVDMKALQVVSGLAETRLSVIDPKLSEELKAGHKKAVGALEQQAKAKEAEKATADAKALELAKAKTLLETDPQQRVLLMQYLQKSARSVQELENIQRELLRIQAEARKKRNAAVKDAEDAEKKRLQDTAVAQVTRDYGVPDVASGVMWAKGNKPIPAFAQATGEEKGAYGEEKDAYDKKQAETNITRWDAFKTAIRKEKTKRGEYRIVTDKILDAYPVEIVDTLRLWKNWWSKDKGKDMGWAQEDDKDLEARLASTPLSLRWLTGMATKVGVPDESEDKGAEEEEKTTTPTTTGVDWDDVKKYLDVQRKEIEKQLAIDQNNKELKERAVKTKAQAELVAEASKLQLTAAETAFINAEGKKAGQFNTDKGTWESNVELERELTLNILQDEKSGLRGAGTALLTTGLPPLGAGPPGLGILEGKLKVTQSSVADTPVSSSTPLPGGGAPPPGGGAPPPSAPPKGAAGPPKAAAGPPKAAASADPPVPVYYASLRHRFHARRFF